MNGASLGGAIDNRGTLVIERCVFNGNHSDNFGGAISNFGSLTVSQSTFMNNSADWGGAIHNRGGTATIDSTTFTGNTATWGGAIDNDSSTAGEGFLTVSNSSLVGNTAAWGGAIGNGSFATIIGVTISGNTGTEAAGGIDSSGTLTLINSTISGNTAGGDGGGLEISNSATLRNVTIFGNRAGTKGSNDYTGGGLRKEGATVAMHNTLIAGNVRGIGAGTIDDVRGWGNAITGFNNIIADAASTTVPTNGVDGNIVGADWTTVIDPVLKDNGGATRTHAILRSGSAHDGGRNAQALDPAMNPLTTDQRGMPRFVGAVDIGAVELGVAPLPSLTLTYLISPPPFIESSGVGAAIGTVTRTGDLSQALTVFLSSSDVTEAIVPASVTIAAGAASATFSIDAVDDDIHDGLQTVVITASVPATPGGGLQVDDTFGSGGVVTTSLSMNWLPPDAVIAVQSDGKILVAAEDAADGSWRLIRLNADGSFDTTFGTSGQVVTPFSGSLGAIPHKIVVQNDGKILVGGESVLGPAPGVLVAHYNANGTLDTSFANFTGGTPGISNLNGTVGWVSDMAVRSDGRIVLALGGGSTFRAARLTSNGFQDSTFGSSGIRTYSGIAGYASALLLNPDSTFLLAGGDKVARFDADGNQASSAIFGTNGVVTVDFSLSAAVTEQVIGIAATPDGKIVVGYHLFIAGADNSSNFGVARLNANGSFDNDVQR